MEVAGITGIEDCVKFLDQMPENAMKVARTSMRDAARETSKKIRPSIPKRWRSLMKYKVKKSREGYLTVKIGLYNNGKRRGRQSGAGADDWMKAFWANYGTIKHRDPNHVFAKPIKSDVKGRRNNEGQEHQNFFERATRGWEEIFMPAFKEAMIKNKEKFYDR